MQAKKYPVAGRGREPSHRERWVAAKFSVRQSAELSLKPNPPCLSFRFLSSDLARQFPSSQTRANHLSLNLSLKSSDFRQLHVPPRFKCGKLLIVGGNRLTAPQTSRSKFVASICQLPVANDRFLLRFADVSLRSGHLLTTMDLAALHMLAIALL
jgi:hypothetical protein